MAEHPIAAKIRQGALVVDVRSPEEYSEEHFPGAVNIPVNEILRRMGDFGDKNRPIVLYCASGARSSLAAMYLKQGGYADVINAGGLDDMPF